MSENPFVSPDHVDPPAVLEFKDRTVGLIVFGVIQLLFAALCAMAVPLMFVTLVMSRQPGGPPVNSITIIPATIMYAALAVLLGLLGGGSILGRRWARALTLIFSWLWLIGGIGGMVFWLLFFPEGFAQAMQQGAGGRPVPHEMVVMIMIVAGLFSGCLYVIVPAAFVLFYQSKHVKATCERKDPKTRWTDRCPLPVLAMSILLATMAVSMATVLPLGLFPLFGTLLTGLPGALVLLVLIAILAYLARETYRIKMIAWWGTLAVIGVWSVSATVTFARVGLMEMYEKIGMPEEQLAMIRQMGIDDKMPMALSVGIFAAAYLGYLLFVRQYFVAAKSGPHDAGAPSACSPQA
jgi:hypothetical protein